MKHRPFLIAALALLAFSSLSYCRQWKYPPTKKEPVTDTYFGKSVTDDYRWLEDMTNPEVTNWFKAQEDFTESVLSRIPGRDALVNEFTRLDALEPAKISDIMRKGGRYFYKKTLPSETVGKLYYRQGKNGAETLLFDPTQGSEGKSVSISFYQPSEDGKQVALGIAEGGSESATIRILNLETGRFLPESISPCWFGLTGWTPDNKGFLYNLMSSTDVHAAGRELNTRMLYHATGTDPKDDKEIFSAAKYPALHIQPEEIPIVNFSADHRYIFGMVASVRNEIEAFYATADELLKPTIDWRPLLAPEDDVTDISLDGTTLYMLSHKNAPKFKLLKTDIRHPDVPHAEEVLAEGKEKIEGFSQSKNDILAILSDGVNNTLHRYDMRKPGWSDVKLPLQGTVGASSYDVETNDFILTVTSWNKPEVKYDYDASSSNAPQVSIFHEEVRYPGTDDIVVEEVEAPSYDGTMVPLSIFYNKNTPRDGSASCYLAGYGAYGISAKPGFSVLNLALVTKGVILARAHVRGGGEKGNDWYQAGYKATKPNTWKDFIACAEYLIKKGYTSSPKLFGMGTSAGGILIGRSITERPDLFAAAICNVGVANILRMESSPNGPINAKEFGTIKDSAECMAMLEMDALAHVKDGTRYPAVICVAGMNDPRVIAWEPGKFAAALQNASASGKPVLLQVNYDNGHFTEDKKVTFRNFAGMFSFCLWQTGHPGFQPLGQ